MKNKVKLCIVALGMAVVLCLVLYGGPKEKETYTYSEAYVQVKELPALLDFYYFTKQEWEEKLKEAEMDGILTPEGVAWILEQTGSASYITYDAKEKEGVSRAEWNAVYEELLHLLDEDGSVKGVDEVILKKESDTLVCSGGEYDCGLDGISMEPMTAMGFYIKENRIIGIRSLQAEATLSNVYVEKAEAGRLAFLTNQKRYEIALAAEAPDQVQGHVCDLLWENGAVSRVQVKGDTIRGDLIAVSETGIEIEGYGEIRRSEKLPVYKTYGTIEEKELSDIVIANMKVEYVVAKDCVEAILLMEPAQISRIRVLLLTDDAAACRKEVCISADGAYQVKTASGKQKKKAKEVVRASELFAAEAGGIRVRCLDENDFLYLCDASGKRISKGYQGKLDVRRYPEGYAVVNELPIEQYLCAVVPSEMPSSYEPEALKAQAICARSYARIQLERGDYAAFGAHVDDTTNYQVYNKQDRNDKTTAAVWDTAGMVMTYGGEVAEAYYFSTSAGVTGDGEAWGLHTKPEYDYLQGRLIREGGGTADLSSEEAFGQFLAAPDAASYESAMPFFRWNAVADYATEEALSKIQTILSTRKERTPEEILFRNKKGKQVKSMKQFGALVQIGVVKRSASGVILQLQLDYEKGTVQVGNEYNIRAVLGCGVTDLTLADGSRRNAALLPSAYATIARQENGTYALSGGGYGHGIGMSQNGAQAMAQSGKSCEEILKFFFEGIEIGMGEAK